MQASSYRGFRATLMQTPFQRGLLATTMQAHFQRGAMPSIKISTLHTSHTHPHPCMWWLEA